MKMKILILVLVLASVLMTTGGVLANGGFSLSRWVLSGGASDSTIGNVTIRASLGQPVIGVITNGDSKLSQGFWYEDGRSFLYLPLVKR